MAQHHSLIKFQKEIIQKTCFNYVDLAAWPFLSALVSGAYAGSAAADDRDDWCCHPCMALTLFICFCLAAIIAATKAGARFLLL